MAQQQQIGITPQQEQQMENQLTVVSNAKLAEDGKQINEDVTATLNQENAQTATAAGSFPFAQNASLTDNPQLLDPQVQLQRITVDLNSVPLPALPSVGPATLAPANDAFTRYWNDSVDQLTNGVSPKLAGAFDQMLASNTSSGNSDIAFSGAPDPWAIAGMANPIAGLESLANGVQSGVNDILNSSVVQDAIGGVKSDVNMLVAGTAGLLTRVFTQPEDPMLAATDPQAYEDAQLTSQRLTGQVVSALSWDPSNPEQLRGYDAATKAQIIASLLLGGYGLVDAGVSALRGSYQLSDLFAGSAGRIGTTPLSAQLGQLDFSAFIPSSYPEGLAYRLDLPEHLAGPDGFTNPGQLSGPHNLINATAALDAQGATYALTPTSTNGISVLDYSYANSVGKTIAGSKTVYDPAIFSDETMLNMAQNAGQSGFESYLQNPSQRIFNTSQNGVNFRVYINFDRQTGAPYVGNVHPVQ